MILTKKFDEALIFALELHREQLRKGTNVPYFTHLVSVASLVLEHGGSENQAIAALLHDSVEDQGGYGVLKLIEEKFGNEVAKIVEDCTDSWEYPKLPWKDRKEKFILELSKKDPKSLLVILADKVHNSETLLAELNFKGESVWNKFKGGAEGTLWYLNSIFDIMHQKFPCELTNRFGRILYELEE